MTPVWLFDLDNTLHNASAHIFPHINRAMTAYIEQHLGLGHDEANRLRVHYWHRYGATLLGLVRHHGTDPHHFLAETHRFDALQRITVFDHALDTMLRQLPGRKLVVSNGPKRYVDDGCPDSYGVALNLQGEHARLAQDPASAAEFYRAAVAAFAANPEQRADNMLYLAEALADLGDTAQARDWLVQATELFERQGREADPDLLALLTRLRDDITPP